MKTRTIKNPNLAGFTLIEVMITVAVVAILAAVAMPQYFDYVTRSRLVEAKTNLVDMRTRLEQYFLDNRKFPLDASCAPVVPVGAKFFDIICASDSAANKYTVTANGKGSMAGFVFTIDQTNAKKTTGLKTGWGTPPKSCWISRKNDDC